MAFETRAETGWGLQERAVQAFRTKLRGQLIRPGDPEYDGARSGPQRHDRQIPALDRPLPGCGGHHGRDRLWPRQRHDRGCSKRRAQRGRSRDRRRRAGHRPLADEGHPGRSRRGHRAGGANVDLIKDWTIAYWDALHPLSEAGAYVNFMMEEGVDRIRATYRDNYDRLVRVKNTYDPKNFFHVNQNIRPTA